MSDHNISCFFTFLQDSGNFIDSCHLLELESFGLPYTWFNKRKDSSIIFEKLDRVLVDDCWIPFIKDSGVKSLPIGSNHGPVVLHIDRRTMKSKVKPFRCEEF